MASEVKFYEQTLSNLKTTNRKLKRLRNDVVKDYISDRISRISQSVAARSEVGSIFDR